jgi:RNA polymerase sigma-70 factor (ECF subfamily)
MNEIEWVVLEDTTVAACVVADPNNFLVLYDRYFPRVYTYMRYRTPDVDTADDLTAQTFEQALARIESYDPRKGPFVAWLFAIARNLVNDSLRRRRRIEWLPLESLEGRPGRSASPEKQSELADEQRRLLSAMKTLSADQRDLLALKFAGEMTNREIARLTGMSEQNVGVILHRSIKKLRNRLEEEPRHE